MAMSSVFAETTYKTYCNITIQNQILLKWDLSLFWLRLWKTAVTHKLNYNKIQNNIILVILVWSIPLRKKCLYSEFFWSIFSCIWFEICKSPYSVRIREKKTCTWKVLVFGLNKDQKNSKHGHFSRSVRIREILFQNQKIE